MKKLIFNLLALQCLILNSAFGLSINGPTTVTECDLVTITVAGTQSEINCVITPEFTSGVDAQIVSQQWYTTSIVYNIRFFYSTKVSLALASSCGNIPYTALTVNVNQVTIGSIAGPSQSFGHCDILLTTPAVPNAASYVWATTNGWQIQSNGNSAVFTPNGANTTITLTVILNGGCWTNTLTHPVVSNWNPVIVGPLDICIPINEEFYTYSMPANMVATSWSVTPNLQIVNTTPTEIRVTPIAGQSPNAIITAYYVDPNNTTCTTFTSKRIWIGKPQTWVSELSNPPFLEFTRHKNTDWQVCDWTQTYNGVTYNWYDSPMKLLKCSPHTDIYWTNHVVATNACGTTIFDNDGTWPRCGLRLGEETNENSVEEVTLGSSFVYPAGGNLYTLVVNLASEVEFYDISIYDSRGLLIRKVTEKSTGKAGANQFNFSMDKEATGLYFCKIATSQEQKVIKFITE